MVEEDKLAVVLVGEKGLGPNTKRKDGLPEGGAPGKALDGQMCTRGSHKALVLIFQSEIGLRFALCNN